MRSNKERKAKERQSKKDLGLVRWECWCTPEHREVMQALLACIQADYMGELKVNGFIVNIQNNGEL